MCGQFSMQRRSQPYQIKGPPWLWGIIFRLQVQYQYHPPLALLVLQHHNAPFKEEIVLDFTRVGPVWSIKVEDSELQKVSKCVCECISWFCSKSNDRPLICYQLLLSKSNAHMKKTCTRGVFLSSTLWRAEQMWVVVVKPLAVGYTNFKNVIASLY